MASLDFDEYSLLNQYPDLNDAFHERLKSVSTALDKECNHSHRELRAMITAAGATVYHSQCMDCGQKSQIRKIELAASGVDVSTIRYTDMDTDRAIYRAYWDQREARRKAICDRVKLPFLKEARNRRDATVARSRDAVAEQRRAYDEYMQSPEWKAIRALVFERSSGICEGCRRRKAVHVHHLTYDHFGAEFLWELAAVCLTCHERYHGRQI